MRPFERDVQFDLITQGKTVKVVAIDVETSADVYVIAAGDTPTSTLYQVAYEKLLSRLGKLSKAG